MHLDNDKMKRRFNPSKLVLILIVPILILSISLHLVAFDESYYHNQFEKLAIYGRFNIPKQQLNDVNHALLNYLRHGQGDINISINTININSSENASIDEKFFNERETTHLVEVRELIQTSLIILYFCLTVFILLMLIIYFRKKEQFIRNMMTIMISGSALNIIAMLSLGTMLLTDFSGFFTKFHLALFESDTWLLNPQTDNLIRMFPEQFFYDIGIRIAVNSLIISIVIIFVCIYVKKIMKNK